MSDPATRAVLVGIGAGRADQLTAQARDALTGCDYAVAFGKRADDPLAAIRAELCADLGLELVVVPDPPRERDDPADYAGAVRDWHAARVATVRDVLRPGVAGFLVWGDPSLYDSTIRIVGDLGVPYRVVPGLAAPQLLAAAHGIVLHEIGRPVLVTTGRRLLEDARSCDNLVVMLDGRLTCRDLPAREPGDWSIWWGANLGTDSERLVAGRLVDVLPEIERHRAAAKEQAGWVMDTYLVRRTCRG